MRFAQWCAVLFVSVLTAAACGWSPPSASPPPADTCTSADGPTEETVAAEIDSLPPVEGQAWQETARGHTTNCRLFWVQAAPTNIERPDGPRQVLFFDHNTPLGPATAEPRPYLHVPSTGEDTVTVQYQWRQGDDEPCCPTGIGTVRFHLDDDGNLAPLDPIPNS